MADLESHDLLADVAAIKDQCVIAEVRLEAGLGLSLFDEFEPDDTVRKIDGCRQIGRTEPYMTELLNRDHERRLHSVSVGQSLDARSAAPASRL